MLQGLNPLTIVSLLMFGSVGVGYVLNKIEDKASLTYKTTRIYFLKKKVVKLENRLNACYGVKAEDNKTEKLHKCLLKAGTKDRKIKRCRKKYGSD